MTTWLIVAVIALFVLGPKQMPSTMRKIGRLIGQLQRMSDEFKRQLMSLDRGVENEVASSFKNDRDDT